MDIEYKENLDEFILNLLDIEFKKYAVQSSIICDYKFCNFIAKEKNKIIGVLRGHSNYDTAVIDDLIVLEEYRKRGVGSNLIKLFENYHRNKGFKYINVVTLEFQAPKFYEKCGFTLEFKKESKDNSKLTRYYFIKSL